MTRGEHCGGSQGGGGLCVVGGLGVRYLLSAVAHRPVITHHLTWCTSPVITGFRRSIESFKARFFCMYEVCLYLHIFVFFYFWIDRQSKRLSEKFIEKVGAHRYNKHTHKHIN